MINRPITYKCTRSYKMEMKVPESVDTLQWWKLNEHRYPKLSFLAKTVLCIPPTSVPCERVFSSAGYILNKTRSSLEPSAFFDGTSRYGVPENLTTG